MRLDVRRFRSGSYGIEGRRVQGAWGQPFFQGRDNSPILVVRECNTEKEMPPNEAPLAVYLQQTANAAASLGSRGEGGSIVAQLPQELRLTFDNTPEKYEGHWQGDRRLLMMQLACEEARLRGKAATALVKPTDLSTRKESSLLCSSLELSARSGSARLPMAYVGGA